MKKILLLAVIQCWLNISSYGQAVFNREGKLIELKAPDHSITQDNVNMRILNDTARKYVRELLLQKIDEALHSLTDLRSSSNAFYGTVFGSDTTIIAAQLTTLKTLLENEDAASFDAAYRAATRYSGIDTVAATIKDVVYHTDAYQLTGATDNKASFTKTDLFNLFLVQHYNKTLDLFKSLHLTIDRLQEIDELLTRNKHKTDSLLHLYRTKRQKNKQSELYCAITQYRAETEQELRGIMALLKDNQWFRQWFWIRGGDIKLNPLDFTTAEFINNNPEFDIVRANPFNQYIDSLLARYIRRDSTQRIEEFKTILRSKGTGKDAFSFKDRIAALQSANEATKNKLQAVTTTLNTVEIPKDGAYFTLSADPGIEFDNEDGLLTAPLHTDENKTIVIHNIPDGTKAGVLQTNTAIADRSVLQRGFDSIAAQTGAIATLVSQLGPLSGVFNLINGIPFKSNTTITPALQTAPGARAAIAPAKTVNIKSLRIKAKVHAEDNVAAAIKLKDYFRNICAYDPTLFSNYFDNVDYDNVEETLETAINSYMSVVDSQIANGLLVDSVRAVFLINIFVNSSMPPATKLEAKKADGSHFQSRILHTEESDETIKKKVTVFIVKGDTTVLKKFQYKVGQNHRFQLGAGLAYTFQNYYQSTADVNSGQVTITNSIQQFRFVAGLNAFIGKGIFLQDNRFWGCWRERLSVFAGVGIPDPLKNIYIGPSYDLWPGLRITTGVHIVEANKYVITNNIITENRLHYKPAGIFVALIIDPSSLVSAVTSFKK